MYHPNNGLTHEPMQHIRRSTRMVQDPVFTYHQRQGQRALQLGHGAQFRSPRRSNKGCYGDVRFWWLIAGCSKQYTKVLPKRPVVKPHLLKVIDLLDTTIAREKAKGSQYDLQGQCRKSEHDQRPKHTASAEFNQGVSCTGDSPT